MTDSRTAEEQAKIPVNGRFRAYRASQGSEHTRSFSLDMKSHNGSIYLTENEYGGRTLCPTEEDLRWLRDVLNRMEFCDHELGDIQQPCTRDSKPYRVCKKCRHWIYEGTVETTFRLVESK